MAKYQYPPNEKQVKRIALQALVFFPTICPFSLFIFYNFNPYSFTAFILSSLTLFSLSIKAYEAFIEKLCYDQFYTGYNAINHNINEALLSSARRNESVSIADSLSIKENLYVLSSIGEIRFVPQHYAKVEPVVSISISDYKKLAKNYNINLNVSFEADKKIRVIRFDASLLNKALSIIISNAISVTKKNSRIDVHTQLCKDYYSIVVRDYSGGIRSSVIQALRQTRVNSTGRRVDQHHRAHYGLGLITLRRLIIGSNISVSMNSDKKSHSVIVKISRRLEMSSVKECANL